MSDAEVLFKTQPVEGLPVPGWIMAIMVFCFSLPLMVIPITIKEVPSNPWILLAWLAAPFPLSVLYVLRRLFTRFEMVLYADGGVHITKPFSQTMIASGQLHSIIALTRAAHVSGQGTAIRIPIPWLYFYDASDRQITMVSPSAFRAEDVSGFLNALARYFPKVLVEHRE